MIDVNQETKAIFNPSIARNLLKAGHKLVDIKPNRENALRTVFYFSVTPEFIADFNAEQEKTLSRHELAQHGIETAVID